MNGRLQEWVALTSPDSSSQSITPTNSTSQQNTPAKASAPLPAETSFSIRLESGDTECRCVDVCCCDRSVSCNPVSLLPLVQTLHQLLACLPRSVLSHLCYSFFLRKNVVVYSNSVHRLPALYSLLERIAGTTEGAYVGIPFYPQCLLRANTLFALADESNDTDTPFFACVLRHGRCEEKHAVPAHADL